MKKQLITAIVLATILGIYAPLASAAGFTYYTNYSAFTNAVAGQTSFTQNFSSFSTGKLNTNSLTYSDASFSFTALNVNPTNASPSFWYLDVSGNRTLQTGDAPELFTLTNISANTYAMGGNFYPIYNGEIDTDSYYGQIEISVLFSDLTSTIITNGRGTTNVADWFFGWVTDAPGTTIKSMTISSPLDSDMVGASQIVLAVPEPSTYALLLMGAGTALWMAKRRKR